MERSFEAVKHLRSTLELEAYELSNVHELLEMDRMLREISTSIRRRINCIAPAVRRLPSEVLFVIFDYLRWPARQFPFRLWNSWVPELANEPPPPSPDHHSLVAVTHVCTLWRQVALNLPSLWADIDCRHASALTFASRAGSLPLRVHVNTRYRRLSKRQRRVVQRVRQRIHTLVLRLAYRAELPIFRRLLLSLSCSLSSLLVLIENQYDNIGVIGTPLLLFGGAPTALKHLFVASTKPLFPSDACSNLVSFRLKFKYGSFETPSYRVSLLAFLSQAPALEELSLDMGAWPANTRSGDVLPFPAYLPRLRTLNIAGMNTFDWSTFVCPTHGALPLPHPKDELSDTVIDTDRASRTWLIRGRAASAPHLSVSLSFAKDRLFDRQTYESYWGPLSGTLAPSAGTLRLTVLHRYRNLPHARGDPDALFGHPVDCWPRLETLIVRLGATVRASMLARLAKCLVHVLEEPSGGRTVPFPALRTLVVSVLGTPEGTEDLCGALFAAMETRAAMGFPIRRLFVCSPARQGPDYSVYGLHGAEWVSFSSSDVGSSACDSVSDPGRFEGGGSSCGAETMSACREFDAAWEVYSDLGTPTGVQEPSRGAR
ncbi:hypothetical protein C8Q77DRAFT_1156042 [Trametes polyzona]|nr:hypothetical protein C8Q77DRAFT_1156042 [Trametes polyzona]